LFSYLSVSTHYESISRGVIDSKDLVYFFSVIFLGLVLSEITLSKRNIAD
jgi:ABC-2 type transport system permease protein